MSEVAVHPGRTRDGLLGLIDDLNGRWHRPALWAYMFIVIAHWMEHLFQAFQVYVLGWARPDAGGFLGLVFPSLVKTEALHYGYAIVMLLGLFLLRPGFAGRARNWWDVAIVIQFWHHFEHAILLAQASMSVNFFGGEVPTSVVQVIVPRVELHLLYNALVFVPMVIAVYEHMRPSEEDRHKVTCTCATESRRELAAARANA